MKPFLLSIIGFVLITSALAADSPLTADALAHRLSSAQMGNSYVRLMMAIKGRQGSALQLQIKQRRTAAEASILYQVLWPKPRKGDAVLLRQDADGTITGTVYVPPAVPRALSPGEIEQGLLGSDLSYEDAVENFFGWKNQALVGTEIVSGVNCVILESKPGNTEQSHYGSVRSAIDTKRMVPMRIEKFLPSGRIARRIETTRVANDDEGRPVPADLVVHGAEGNTETDLIGSRIRHDVTYTDAAFGVNAMKELSSQPVGNH